MSHTTRTRASRRRNTAWNRFFLFPAAVALAIAAWSAEGGTPAGVWIAGAALAAGGLLTGVLAARDTVTPRLATSLLAPIPVVAFAGLVMAAYSETGGDLLLAGLIVGSSLLLFDVPLAASFRYTSGQRSGQLAAAGGNPSSTSLDRELDLATDQGRATTVVREYVQDDEGRGHLETDTRALESRGYEVVSIVNVGQGGVGTAVSFAVAAAGGLATSERPRIVATFRLRSGQDDGTSAPLPGPMVASLDALKFGCLSVALITACTIAGMAAMVVGFLLLGVLEPDIAPGSPLGSLPPLAGLAIAVVGSVLLIRWLRART